MFRMLLSGSVPSIGGGWHFEPRDGNIASHMVLIAQRVDSGRPTPYCQEINGWLSTFDREVNRQLRSTLKTHYGDNLKNLQEKTVQSVYNLADVLEEFCQWGDRVRTRLLEAYREYGYQDESELVQDVQGAFT